MKSVSIYHQTKVIALFLTIFISGTFSQAQDITGQWNGVLSVQGINLRVVFHIKQNGDGYTSTMDSPDQGAFGIPVTTTTFDESKLSLAAPNIGLTYEGEFKTDSIAGTFKQGALSIPVTLKRIPVEIPKKIKPVPNVIREDVAGQWNGVLSIQGMRLRIIFHVKITDEEYAASMDIPEQGAIGIPITDVTFDGSKLLLDASGVSISYEGEFKTDSIVGTFKQGPWTIPLILKKTMEEIKPLSRPQEPKPPYPYRSEDLTFDNKPAGVTLAGTLTMPETGGNFTAVILITGSGAQNRDEEIMGHKPFLVIADYLTRRGIAVLRFDDRGTAQSTGDIRTATTADLATDVESAIAYLKTRKEINPRQIGLMGHSEGGVIAPMIAARSKDVAFIVMLAGTGIRGDALLLLQEEAVYKVSGLPDDNIAKLLKINAKVFDKIVHTNELVPQQEITDFMTTLEADITAALPETMMTAGDYIKSFAVSLSSPWIQYFLRYDPAPALERVKCPVLAVNGSKDLQVPAKENLTAISASLKKGGNKKVTIKEYPGLNHLFQECTTGSPSEYSTIEQTFSPDVLKDLADWILLSKQ